MRKGLIGFILVLTPIWLCGCQKKPISDGSSGVPTIEKVDPIIVSADNRFGFGLFSKLSEADPTDNIFISPLSIAIALTMTYNGAGGETKEAMAKVLGVEGMDLNQVNEANLELRRMLENIDPKVELLISNSLWARKGTGFKEDFLDRNRRFFEARIEELDFLDPNAPSVINKWVESSTKGKIEKIIDRIDPYTVMFLINALYFKGIWRYKFDKGKTKDMPFHTIKGEERTVPMMTQSGKFQYLRGDEFQAISLPYGDGRVSMYIFLPDPDRSINLFLKELSLEKWEEWIEGFKEEEGDIFIPRFKLEYEEVLNDALKALGMEAAFDPDRANFEGMRTPPPNLFIQEVKHKTVVEVNEEGTEAAAVTSVGVGITAIPQKFTFMADRPFFFAICDNKIGAIIFMGVLRNP